MTNDEKITHLKGFYGMTTLEELVIIQSTHICRLQDELSLYKPKQPALEPRSREG